MSPTALVLIPIFIQAALTFALLFTLGPARVTALRRGEVKLGDIALGQNAWPDRITQISNSFKNQFELPILFYVVVLLAIVTRKVDMVLVGAAWVFSVSRLIHALVHVTSNAIRYRFNSYVLGAVTLVVMWVWLAIRIFIDGTP